MTTTPRYSKHAPDCESLCTDGEDCNCGAAMPKRQPRVVVPAVIAPEPQWRPGDGR
jgi:hypothetical protein